MDSKLTIGDKIDLEKIDKRIATNSSEDKVIYVSQILDSRGEDNLLVSMPFREGKLIPIAVGQEFISTFYTKHGLLQCNAVVVGRFKKGSLFLMELELTSILSKIQRREFFRLPCRDPIEYRILSKEEREHIEKGEEYSLDEADLQWKNGIMLDLSGGGARFVSRIHDPGNIIVHVKFNITIDDKQEVFYAFAELLRCQRNQNNTDLYDHHIEFWNMSQATRELLVRHIFNQQRLNKAKQLS